MFKYGFFSGPYFPVFGLNTGKHGPENSAFGHFSRNVKKPIMDTNSKWEKVFKSELSKIF